VQQAQPGDKRGFPGAVGVLRALSGHGGMLSIAEPVESVRTRISAWGDRVSIAAVNGPTATVVSGEPEALRELIARCEEAGVRSRLLPVDYASHCAQVEEIREELLDSCSTIEPRPGEATFFSTLLGTAVDTADLKSQYPAPYGQPADPRLYARVVEAFPSAWIEDPAITPETPAATTGIRENRTARRSTRAP